MLVVFLYEESEKNSPVMIFCQKIKMVKRSFEDLQQKRIQSKSSRRKSAKIFR